MGKWRHLVRLGTLLCAMAAPLPAPAGERPDRWQGVLYPECVPKRRWFEVYAETFNGHQLRARPEG